MDTTQVIRRVAGLARRAKRRLTEEQVVMRARLELARGSDVDRLRVFADVNDETWVHLNTDAYRRQPLLRKLLPQMPPAQLQERFVGSSGDASLRAAWRTYQLWLEIAARNGRPVTRASYVLDFGCGWGRTLRFFLRDVPARQLYGVDVLPEALEACRATNPWCQFQQVPSFPPTDLPSERFDLIYLYSVFSHLSEEAHQRWLDEFHRILKPGGIVIATTWHRQYIEWCESAREGVTDGTHAGSKLAFSNPSFWLEKYDRGEYCHSPVGGGTTLEASFYGETCIPEAYVRREWSNRFEIREYLHTDRKRLYQDVIVARKR